MKIHTDTLTIADIQDCVPRGCYLALFFTVESGKVWIDCVGSRKRDHGFVVRLSGSSKNVMWGLPDKAATYDEWGFFLANIYRLDDNAICGQYKNGRDFVDKTESAYPIIAR